MIIPRLGYVHYHPTAYWDEKDDSVEIPDAPTVLDTLRDFGYPERPQAVEYDVPPIIKYPSFLFAHQQEAVHTLYNGGVLSDAPRMGKTVTAIGWTHVQHFFHPEWTRCTIICPAILIPQWKSHLAKFGHPDVQYDVVSMDAIHYPNYTHMLIIDEARHFKHSDTSRYQKVEYMYRDVTLCLEATPLPDRGTDIWALLHLVRPSWFPTLEQFKKWYTFPQLSYTPCHERLLEDTRNLWVWRKKQVSRPRVQIDFEDEKHAFEYVKDLPRPLIVFTDTRKRANWLAKKLGGELLTGDYKLGERAINVQKFQEGEIDCLVCTFWAAGEGLDLSRAKSAATFGYDWTPSTIEQALARTDHIDPARPKADCFVLLWPGEAKRKHTHATMKEIMLPDWAEDISDRFVLS